MTNDEGDVAAFFFFFVIRHSSLSDSLESLRVPVRLRDRAFAFVFEKFVDGGEDYAGPAGFDPDVEVEPILDEMDVAVTDHPEKFAGNLEVVGVNDAVFDRESGFGGFGDAIAGAGDDRGGKFGERAE